MLDARAAAYGSMAVTYTAVTNEDRFAASNAAVRQCNNFVKAALLDAACRAVADTTLVAADVACGRGQDVPKWSYAAKAAGTRISAYYGLDLSEMDIEGARAQLTRFLPETASSTHALDAGVEPWPIPTASVHVLSCQLALHYFCGEEAHMRHFMSECARVLKPDGLALFSFTDGRSVVRHARRVAAAAAAADSSHIVVSARLFQLRVPAELARATLASPWGNPYVFSMPGAITDVPEYLCHEGAVLAVALEVGGFRSIWSRGMDEAALELLAKAPRYQAVASKMRGHGLGTANDPETLEVAGLYRCMVLAKSPTAAKRFKDALWS